MVSLLLYLLKPGNSASIDVPIEAFGINPIEGCNAWPRHLVDSVRDPNDPENQENMLKGLKLAYDYGAGWFEYDFKPGQTKEHFIESTSHLIRPSTFDTAPD